MNYQIKDQTIKNVMFLFFNRSYSSVHSDLLRHLGFFSKHKNTNRFTKYQYHLFSIIFYTSYNFTQDKMLAVHFIKRFEFYVYKRIQKAWGSPNVWMKRCDGGIKSWFFGSKSPNSHINKIYFMTSSGLLNAIFNRREIKAKDSVYF